MSTARVHRGGSWYDLARACQSAERNGDHPIRRDNLLGFRVARTTADAGGPGPAATGGPP